MCVDAICCFAAVPCECTVPASVLEDGYEKPKDLCSVTVSYKLFVLGAGEGEDGEVRVSMRICAGRDCLWMIASLPLCCGCEVISNACVSISHGEEVYCTPEGGQEFTVDEAQVYAVMVHDQCHVAV